MHTHFDGVFFYNCTLHISEIMLAVPFYLQ